MDIDTVSADQGDFEQNGNESSGLRLCGLCRKNNQPEPHARKAEEQFTVLGKTMQPEAKELRSRVDNSNPAAGEALPRTGAGFA